jgi:SOS-response transcriptional repressor LexA
MARLSVYIAIMQTRKQLTEKQYQTLDFVNAFVMDHGYSPTVNDVCVFFGIQNRAAQDRLDALHKNGYITKEPGKQRTMRVVKDA